VMALLQKLWPLGGVRTISQGSQSCRRKPKGGRQSGFDLDQPPKPQQQTSCFFVPCLGIRLAPSLASHVLQPSFTSPP
jgi:hypothetical protein